MTDLVSKLEKFESPTPSRWREKAERRQENKTWLRYSQSIAMKMLDKMEELPLNQTQLAERMGCSQQYVARSPNHWTTREFPRYIFLTGQM